MSATDAMRVVFGELAFIVRCAEVEAALARAQARLGIVPSEAAAAISATVAAIAANPEALDLERLERETETVGYPILPLVRQLAEQAGPAGRWLHWGAPPGRSPRSVMARRAWHRAPSWRASLASPSPRSPGMSRATGLPRPCSSSRSSAAAWPRSRST